MVIVDQQNTHPVINRANCANVGSRPYCQRSSESRRSPSSITGQDRQRVLPFDSSEFCRGEAHGLPAYAHLRRRSVRQVRSKHDVRCASQQCLQPLHGDRVGGGGQIADLMLCIACVTEGRETPANRPDGVDTARPSHVGSVECLGEPVRPRPEPRLSGESGRHGRRKLSATHDRRPVLQP